MVFNLNSLLSNVSKGAKTVKRAAKVYKKAKTGKVLTRPEQKVAKGLQVISKTLKKTTPLRFEAPSEKPGISMAEYEDRKKYKSADKLASFISAISSVKGAKKPLKDLFREGQNKLTTARGYTQAGIIKNLVEENKVDWDWRKRRAALLNPKKYLKEISETEKEGAIARILNEKERVRQERLSKIPTLEDQFRERAQAPMQGAKGDIAMKGLRDSIGAFGEGYLSGRTVGLSGVIKNKVGDFGLGELYSKEGQATRYVSPIQQKKLENDRMVASIAPQATGLIGQLIGGAQTYGSIAGKIKGRLGGLKGRTGAFLKRKPVFTTYLVQNPLEEIVEAGIRKSTGQQYTVNDFMWGMGTGSLFASLGLDSVKQKGIDDTMEIVVKQAEAKKGSKLTVDEFNDTILNARLLGNKTGRDLMNEANYMFGERGLAYKTGKKGVSATDLEQGLGNSPKAILEARRLEELAVEKSGKSNSRWNKIKKKWFNARTGFFDKGAAVDDLMRGKMREGKLTDLQANEFEVKHNTQLRASKVADNLLEKMGAKEKTRKIKGDLNIDEAGQVISARRRLEIGNHKKLSDAEYKNIFGIFRSDDKVISDTLSGKYQEIISDYREMVAVLEDYTLERGLAGREALERSRKVYKDYAPLYAKEKLGKDVDFSKFDSPVGSLSKQSVFMELIGGSGKVTKNPYEALFDKLNATVKEGTKSDVAKVFGDWAKIEGFGDEMKILKKGEKAKHSVSYFEDGKKVKVAVPKGIADFAKEVGVAPTNWALNTSRFLMRGFKAGTTGLNPAFALSNIAKDIQTAKINSKYGLRVLDVVMGLGSSLKSGAANTSVGKKLGIKEGKLAGVYKKLGGGAGSEFDIYKGNSKKTLNDILSISQQKGMKRKVATAALRTGRGLRDKTEAVFNLSEQMTRLGVFRRNVKSYTKKFLKDGMDKKSAAAAGEKVALTEAMDASANFLRGGRYKNYITGLFPYKAAGFAGARSVQKSFKRDPFKTSFRIVKNLILPEAGLMAWNMVDPERKKIYQDIQPWEKDMNFIFITPWAEWDDSIQGYKGVWKIPKPPGLMAIGVPLRRQLEASIANEESPGLVEYINSLSEPVLGTGLSEGDNALDVAGNTVLNTLTPHLIKAPLELKFNKKFWEGKDLIPDYLKSKKPEDQHYDWTPEEYQWLGEKLKMSPLQIERIIKSYGGSLTEQVIGAKDPLKEITKRFVGTRGGRLEDLLEKKKAKGSSKITLL